MAIAAPYLLLKLSRGSIFEGGIGRTGTRIRRQRRYRSYGGFIERVASLLHPLTPKLSIMSLVTYR